MKTNLVGGAVALALTMALPTAALAQASQAEVDELKNEVRALNEKVAAMEATESKSSWTEKVSVKGDLRYRFEWIDEESATETRERQRIRARLGVYAKPTDTLDLGFELATGGDDPRSTNQTLDGSFSTKDIGVNLAYATWKPMDPFALTFGKMKDQWTRTPIQYFYDSDITPEGIAAKWSADAFFVEAEWFQLDERSSDDDTQHWGAQIGTDLELGGIGVFAALGYYDLIDAQGFNPCFEGECNNNTVNANGNLVYDYNVVQLDLAGSLDVGGFPLSVFASWAQNGDPDDNDTAYSYGAKLGKAGDPRTWEVGLLYQEIEKDALYGQYINSDFGNGLTDSKGWVFSAGYGLMKNWTVNFTYYDNEINQSLPTKEDYERYQLDLQFKF